MARTLVIANPSPDVYGADLQMLQSATALVEAGWRVIVVLPEDGALVPRITAIGAEVHFQTFPVLRKGNASPRALLAMLVRAAHSVPRSAALIRQLRADVLLVNTVTLPWWVLAGRLTSTPTVVHLHEAETEARRTVRRLLMAPVRLASAVIVISRSAHEAMVNAQPALAGRAHLIYNGVPQPPGEPEPARRQGRLRLAVIGRLSPRKAPDVAIEALHKLVTDGVDVELEVVGTAFPGYEWYVEQLHARADHPELIGRVHFAGYQSPIWPVLARADIVLAPSLHEPFGNAVVEAQMSRRPVVAAASLGHLESITDELTGLLVVPGDADAMAAAARRLVEDRTLAARLADEGRREGLRRFSVDRYRREIAGVVLGSVKPD